MPTIGAGTDFGANQPIGERDEQHRADAEREALDVDLADQVADGDRQEQRHQRLLLEQAS